MVGVEFLVLGHAAVGHGGIDTGSHVEAAGEVPGDQRGFLRTQVAVAQGHKSALHHVQAASRAVGAGLVVAERQRTGQQAAPQIQGHVFLGRAHAALGPPFTLREAQVQVQPVGGVDHGLVLCVTAVEVALHSIEHTGQVGAGVVDVVRGEFTGGPADTHVPVGQGQEGLATGLVRGVEAFEREGPRIIAQCTEVEFADIVEYDVGACAIEPLAGAVTVDAHDQSEATGHTGLHSGHGILDDHGVFHRDVQQTGAFQERVRCRFAGDVLLGGQVAVHDLVEDLRQTRRGEDHTAVAAGGDQTHGDPCGLQAFDEFHGAREHPYTVLLEFGVKETVLGGGLTLHGPVAGLGFLVIAGLGQHGTAGREQRANAVLAASSVNVGTVFTQDVENRAVDPAARFRRLETLIQQNGVKKLLPRAGVHAGRVRDHTVHVEDDGRVAGPQHIHRGRRSVVLRDPGHGSGERGSGQNVHSAVSP